MIERNSRFRWAILVMVALTVAGTREAGAGSWSFQYEKGKPLASAGAKVRGHKVSLTPLKGQVYVYATFAMGPKNPIPYVGPQTPKKPEGEPRGRQFITLGQLVKGKFNPAVRFGIHDSRRGSSVPAERGMMYAYLHDGKLEYYGPWIRPNTPYDFKLRLDLDSQQMTAWVSGRGDDRWYLLAENASLINPVKSIREMRTELYPDAAGIDKVIVQARPSPADEKVKPHPLAKKDRVVGPDRGFKFHSMRSTWGLEGRHVTVCRKQGLHFAFPRDVLRIGSNKLFCVFSNCSHTGNQHQSMGKVSACVSYDLGRTWSEPVRFPNHPPEPLRPGEYIQKLSDGTVIDCAKLQFSSKTRVKLRDGSTLLGGSRNFKWNGADCEYVEFFRATDLGAEGESLGQLRAYPPYSLSEPTLLRLPDGRLCAFIRETRMDHFPAVKAFSSDEGKTWQVQELPFSIVGYPCARFLRDGRVMITFRSQVGRAALWAWVGEVDDNTPYQTAGVHFNDRNTVGLKDGGLHIDNDGVSGQCTQYLLRQPDHVGSPLPGTPDTRIDLTVEVKVVANSGRAATLSVPFVGKFRLYPDYVELTHMGGTPVPGARAEVTPGEFHTYRVVRDGGTAKVYVDGKLMITTDKVDLNRIAQSPTPSTFTSWHQLSFGNEAHIAQEVTPGAPARWPGVFLPSRLHSTDLTGYSIWRSFNLTMEHPKTGKYTSAWSADSGEFPDQYQLDHIIEVEASVAGADQGYADWVELDDGRIFVVAYTDDGAPTAWGGNMGITWMRGTFLEPGDLPERDE